MLEVVFVWFGFTGEIHPLAAVVARRIPAIA